MKRIMVLCAMAVMALTVFAASSCAQQDKSSRPSPPAKAECELADGKTIAGEPVKRATGHATRPLTEAQIFEKFADCLDAGGSDIPADVLFNRLSQIQSLSARQITALQ